MVSGSCAQSLPKQEGRGLQWSPRPMGRPCLLLHPLRLGIVRERSQGGADRPWARLPGIGSTWSDVTRGGVRASGPPPAPDPGSWPKARVPGGGAEATSQPPQVEGGARALSVGGELGAETGDPPERAQPSPGLDSYKRRLVLSWDACAFSNIPTATLRGLPHPHMATQARRGWGVGGCRQPQPQRWMLRRTLPQTPLATD